MERIVHAAAAVGNQPSMFVTFHLLLSSFELVVWISKDIFCVLMEAKFVEITGTQSFKK